MVPSAEHHLDTDLENEEILAFVRETGQSAQYVMSLCDGAFVLAEAGLLDSITCTTFPADIPAFRKRYPALDVRENVLFIHHGKYITSAGGARSFDAALYLSEASLWEQAVAERLAQGLVIEWDLAAVPHLVIDR